MFQIFLCFPRSVRIYIIYSSEINLKFPVLGEVLILEITVKTRCLHVIKFSAQNAVSLLSKLAGFI